MSNLKNRLAKTRIAELEKARQRLAYDLTREKDESRKEQMRTHGEQLTEDIRRLRKSLR